MEISDKVGLSIAAVGIIIDLFEAAFPGKIAQMTLLKRRAIFGLGTGLIVVGLLVVFFWPPAKMTDAMPQVVTNNFTPTPPAAAAAPQQRRTPIVNAAPQAVLERPLITTVDLPIVERTPEGRYVLTGIDTIHDNPQSDRSMLQVRLVKS